MPQLNLDFDAPAGAMDTSRAAAQTIRPTLKKLQRLVLAAVRRAGKSGKTDDELVCDIGMLSDTLRARRCELRDAGLVKDSGRRRKTRRGRQAAVWVATNED